MGAVTGRTDKAGFDYIFTFLPATLAATTNTQDHMVFECPAACTVFEVSVTPSLAITGADTNSRNLNVDIPDGTEVGNHDFASGTDGVAGTSIVLYTSTTGTALAAGENIAIESEEVGTGLAAAFPDFAVRIKLQWN